MAFANIVFEIAAEIIVPFVSHIVKEVYDETMLEGSPISSIEQTVNDDKKHTSDNNYPTCPSKHTLNAFCDHNDEFKCKLEGCENDASVNDTIYGCHLCNYGLCESCYNKKHNGINLVQPMSSDKNLVRPSWAESIASVQEQKEIERDIKAVGIKSDDQIQIKLSKTLKATLTKYNKSEQTFETFQMKCDCGKNMRKFKCEVIKCLGEYHKDIKCNECKKKINKSDWIYSCDDDKNKLHPNGNNICTHCFNIIIKTMMTDVTVLKNGFMEKRGKLNKSFQKRYFQLQSDKKLIYYQMMPVKSDNKCGLVDFEQYPIQNMIKIKDIGFHVITEQREWIFRCQTSTQRDEWYGAIATFCKVL
eukprot:508785_1